MSHFLLRCDGGEWEPADELISQGQIRGWIHGRKETYRVIRRGEDFAAVSGYVGFADGDSLEKTLERILETFEEGCIGDLKKRLIGQYVLMIKKGGRIVMFSDFLGARNIFYDEGRLAVSTSFALLEGLWPIRREDLDLSRVFEYLAARHVMYPAWIGRATQHRHILWLLPYEYLVIEIAETKLRTGTVAYAIDNRKRTDPSNLAADLLKKLTEIIDRREFRSSSVAASLTGGRDSRLVAALAAQVYPGIRFRTAVSPRNANSCRDAKVAATISRRSHVPLDIREFEVGQDEDRYLRLTEGMSPSFNQTITPIIKDSSRYSIGFGGVYGTEMFLPIAYRTIEEYIREKIESAKRYLQADDAFWQEFRATLSEEMDRIRRHFRLAEPCDPDYIRIFIIFNTARYSSFIMAAFNNKSYQLEPYGHFPILELALQVSPKLWGDHKKLGGNALVQKQAMSNLNPRLARIMTYSSFRPMRPLTVASFPLYAAGFARQVAHWMKERFEWKKTGIKAADLPGGRYLSNGWETPFLERTAKKYGLGR